MRGKGGSICFFAPHSGRIIAVVAVTGMALAPSHPCRAWLAALSLCLPWSSLVRPLRVGAVVPVPVVLARGRARGGGGGVGGLFWCPWPAPLCLAVSRRRAGWCPSRVWHAAAGADERTYCNGRALCKDPKTGQNRPRSDATFLFLSAPAPQAPAGTCQLAGSPARANAYTLSAGRTKGKKSAPTSARSGSGTVTPSSVW